MLNGWQAALSDNLCVSVFAAAETGGGAGGVVYRGFNRERRDGKESDWGCGAAGTGGEHVGLCNVQLYCSSGLLRGVVRLSIASLVARTLYWYVAGYSAS
jgi:hypothetical protein